MTLPLRECAGCRRAYAPRQEDQRFCTTCHAMKHRPTGPRGREGDSPARQGSAWWHNVEDAAWYGKTAVVYQGAPLGWYVHYYSLRPGPGARPGPYTDAWLAMAAVDAHTEEEG